ncbi:MAG: polysaccharide deacetylase family protein [Rhizobiales bacterium]|nr:polysaccharide deacetylase family protein [Hyphomicrobiales bacterium]
MTELTLTFDNGPDPEATPAVLDVLRDFGILATFFVIGEKLARPGMRALAERARDEGHWLGNHTLSHSFTFGRTDDRETVRAEILDTQQILGDLAHADRLFRPYGGGGVIDRHLLSTDAVDCLIEEGMTCIAWNSVPGDWRDPEGWVETALADCESAAPRVMVLHDIEGGAASRLAAFLERAARLGLTFVQDFPDEVVLIRRGEVRKDLTPFMRTA